MLVSITTKRLQAVVPESERMREEWGQRGASMHRNSIFSKLRSLISRVFMFQYDPTLKTELSQIQIGLFRNRDRGEFMRILQTGETDFDPRCTTKFFENALLQVETYEKNKTRIEKKHEILSQYQTLSPIYDVQVRKVRDMALFTITTRKMLCFLSF